MQSQISQAAPGHRSPPIFSSAANERNERGPDASKDPQDFQSVLEEPSVPAHHAQGRDKEAHSAESVANPDNAPEDNPKSALPDDPEVGKTEVAEIESDEPLPELSLGTEEAAADAITPETTAIHEGEITGQPVENVSRDAPTPRDRPASHVPPWFAATSNPDDGPRLIPPDQKVAADVPNTMPPMQATVGRDQAGEGTRRNPLSVLTVADDAVPPPGPDKELPIAATGRNNVPDQPRETPGAQVKSVVTDAAHEGNAKLLVLANAPGQEGKMRPDQTHLSERQATSEQIPPTAPPLRNSQPLAPVAAAAAALTTPAISGAAGRQEKMIGPGNIHWISEVGFAADVPATELPATSRLQQATLLQQPDLPRNIAAQIAQAVRQAGVERPMELTLNPAELGRVRISMQASDGTMTVHVLTDRPETLDLMRRHIDILAQEFHEIGYGQADFAFGQNAPEGDASPDSGSDASGQSTQTAGGETPEDAPAAINSHLTLHTDRVDIRL